MLIDTSAQLPRWSERQTRRNTFLLGVSVLVVMLLLISALAADRLRVGNRGQLEQIDQLQLRLSEVFGQLRDMQIAQRDYLDDGSPGALARYDRASAAYAPSLAQLNRDTDQIRDRIPELAQEIQGFEQAASEWRDSSQRLIEEQQAQALAPAAVQQRLDQSEQSFERIGEFYSKALPYIEADRETLRTGHRRLVNTSLALLVLVTGATFATLMYGISLVRRIGLLASAQQLRQERQTAYTEVISALNGPTQYGPLLTQALPLVIETAGAQAGVVYSYADGMLVPSAAVGVDKDTLPPLRPNEGLPGRALHQERTIGVADLPADTPYRIHTGVGVGAPRSLATLPLRYGKQLLGVLVVASVNRMSDADVQFLNLTASQLAIAISNVRAFEETQHIADQLSENNTYLGRLLEESDTLQDIGRELVVQSDLQTLLNLVCREARRLLRGDYAAVATMIDTSGSTRWSAIDGATSTNFRDTVFAPHKGMAGRVIDRAGPVVVHHFGQNPEFPVEEFPIHVAEGMRSALGVPLFRKETPVGGLIVGYRSDHEITDAEIELATALASYASIAIENARLLSELQQERDLAELRAQELTEKNKEVERANKLKSEFVANMSHELRTPLNSILALSQILLDRLDGELNEEQDKQVRIIERNGQNLLRLINDILDLSKIEAGRIDLVPSSFKLADVISSVRSTISPLVVDKGLQLQVEMPPDLPVCYTDENKLKQILLNLLSNAAKFTERGGITIRVTRDRLVTGAHNGDPQRSWMTIEVQDTGIGIAPEHQATVWEEFRQIDGSLSRQYEGTGLGLAIVRRLVHLLGGEIELTSALGQGSTFRLSLPTHLSDKPASQPAAAQSKPARLSEERYRSTEKPLVLVVDDDVEVIYILEKYLRDDGYQIETAQTGEEAITKARALHPFAMTLDVMLPGRDGWEVIQELKSDPQTSDIQIIMLSMLDNRQLGYSLGATDYLVKPVSRNDLLRRLNQLRQERPLHTVVVVDDDPIESRVLATALGDESLNVTTFMSGPPALEWLAGNTPDLITLDLMMPGMDGFEVLDAIRRQDHLRDVPVLIITAKDIFPEDRERLNGRISAIIQKGPRQREELLLEVRETLNRRRLMASAGEEQSASL
ncbi:MAG TPA: response regulator [Herpetosiphonaceae bacterium]